MSGIRDLAIRWELDQGAIRGSSDQYWSEFIVDKHLAETPTFYDFLRQESFVGGGPFSKSTRVVSWALLIVGVLVLVISVVLVLTQPPPTPPAMVTDSTN